MCITCGCGPEEHYHDSDVHHHRHHDHRAGGRKGTGKVTVETDILAQNNRLAAANHALFAARGVFVLNLVSSPGSGKTTILEKTLSGLGGIACCAVIEGDQQTDRDAVRIAATGVPVRQINTGAGCHLDAHMIGHAVEHFDLGNLDLLLIENVGNLVCPASFDLGENHKVVVLSVTEGEDKPLKYPQMFHAAHVMLLNKTDLLPHLDFDMVQCREMARRVNPGINILEVSGKTGAGMAGWFAWRAEGMRASKTAAVRHPLDEAVFPNLRKGTRLDGAESYLPKNQG